MPEYSPSPSSRAVTASITFQAATTCLAACPPREFADSNNQCRACSEQCANCSATATNCISCPAYVPYLHGASCAGSCPIGSFASGYACLACDASCTTCSGPAASECASCPAARPHLVGGACTCTAGYTATSDACTQDDECSGAGGGHNCFDGAHCTDLAGSFACACPAGYTGDGVVCDDLDECAAGTAECYSMVKVPPRQCPSSAPAPSQGAPGGPVQLGTPRVAPGHWDPGHGLSCSSEPPPKPPIPPVPPPGATS